MNTSIELQLKPLKTRRRLLFGGAIVSSLSIGPAFPAIAQDLDKNEDPHKMEVITVYGEKIGRSVKDTASSIDVITEEELSRNSDQSTISEVLRGTPNIIYAGNTDAPIIRGTNTKGPVAFGNAYLSKPVPGATISVDGRYATPSELDLGSAGIWDVSSVEVYRGPQTTTQGANSIAGAVIINTKDPTFVPEFEAQILAGSRNKQRASFVASGPLSEDVAARFSVDYSARDTFVNYTNPAFTARDFDLDWENTNVRGKLLWEPGNIPGFSAKLTYSHMEAKRPRFEAVSEPYDDLNYEALSQDNQKTENHAGILDLQYELANGTTVYNQLQYSEGDYDYVFAAPFEGEANRENDNFSNEIRVVFDPEESSIRGVAGLFYWNDKTRNRLDNALSNADADLEHESIAPYGELTWRFADKWALTSGLRYQRDEISHDGIASYVPGVQYSYSEDFSALLPKVSLSYDINKDTTIGVLVNRGYIPGGTGLNFRAGEYYTYDEEYAWNYEIFTRTALWDQRFTLNGNLFYTQKEDSQRSVTNYLNGRPFGSVIVNADKAEVYGLELSVDFQATASLNIYAGLGLLETEIGQFGDDRGEEFVGNEFSKAPGYMYNAGVNWQVTTAFSIGGDVRYTDDYFSDDVNDPALRVGSYTVVNINSTYQITENFEAFAYARNLLDKRAPVSKFSERSGDISAYLLEPRELGVGVRARF